jgi:hypothetical protein
VSYHYGAPAAIGGGPYDRSTSITQSGTGPAFFAAVGSSAYPTLELAVAAWNQMPQGSTGTIVLPNFETYVIDLSGINAIQIMAESQLLIAAAEVSSEETSPLWTNSCVTLRGTIEIVAPPAPLGPDGLALPTGQVQISGICLCGELRLLGEEVCVLITDSTLLPGRTLDAKGNAMQAGEPSLSGSAMGATLCLTRVITGPISLPASCTTRVCSSIVDASSPFCPAFVGPDLCSPGAALHIEDSTVIGRVWVQSIRLASNTIFYARIGSRDPWKAAVWAQRVQAGCVRFCWLPADSITPRRYECLPPNAASQPALEPRFITLRFGEPGYCLLSGDAPLAIWKGADNGSQIGVFLQIQETEAVANIQIRSLEYLPATLERGVFLIPSRPHREPTPDLGLYGHGKVARPCACGEDAGEAIPIGIGIGLI